MKKNKKMFEVIEVIDVSSRLMQAFGIKRRIFIIHENTKNATYEYTTHAYVNWYRE